MPVLIWKVNRMTLMGQKISRKPSKTPASHRTAGGGKDKSAELEAFMRRFRGVPCAICGETFWGDKSYPTAGHHILYRSTHPEYKMTEENIIPLCPVHHSIAHSNQNEFFNWLKDNRPKILEWVQEHNHHRKEV